MKSCETGIVSIKAAALFMILAFACSVHADKKRYVWTIEYDTMPRGEAEIEHYFTLSSPDLDRFSGNTSSELQFEVEVGMSDRWDMRFYQVFNQEPRGEFQYSGFKLESRYRLGEKGLYPVDPLLYFEYKNKPDFSEHKFEFKLVLARDFGGFNVAFNPVFEIEEGGAGEETGLEVKYALGLSYELSRLFSAGVEFFGGESGHYFGPVISHGTERFWVALGSAIKLGTVDEGKAEFQLRTIFGLKF